MAFQAIMLSLFVLSLLFHVCESFDLDAIRQGPLLIDAVVMNAGVDMLAFRMLELHESVDYFLIVESNSLNAGKGYFGNEGRFVQYADKVLAFDVDAASPEELFEALSLALSDLHGMQPFDLVIVSQVEEIPSASVVNQLRQGGISMPYRLSVKHFTYSVACQHDGDWRHAFLSDWGSLSLLLGHELSSPVGDACSLFSLRQGTSAGGDRIPRSVVGGGWFLSRFGDMAHFAAQIDGQNTGSLTGDIARPHCVPYPTYYSDLPVHVEALLQYGWGDNGRHQLTSLTSSQPAAAPSQVSLSVFPRTNRLIIDCILYSRTRSTPRPAVSVLLFHLAELYDIVDYFVIIDGGVDTDTFDSGASIDWVSEWSSELRPFWDKVIYIPFGSVVADGSALRLDPRDELEAVRRGLGRLHGLRVDDIVVVSRADEVPSFKVLNGARLTGLGSGFEGSAAGPIECGYRLSMQYYYGHLNCRLGLSEGALIFHYFSFEKWVNSPLSVSFRTQPNGGWHLSQFDSTTRVPAEMLGLCTNDFEEVDVHSLPMQFERMLSSGWLKNSSSVHLKRMWSVFNSYLEQPVKPLYYFGDEKYVPMKNYFVSSIVDTDLEHHFHLLTHQAAIPADTTKITGAETWIFKNRFIIEAIESNMGRIILFSDIDMQYFKPVGPIVDTCMRTSEMCFQRETLHYGFINTGFIAIACNERTLTFWNKVLEILLETRRQKQGIVYHLLYYLKYDIRWAVFPASVWSWHFSPLHHNVAVHHASFVAGKENKFNQLRYARLYMQHAPKWDDHVPNATAGLIPRHVYIL